MAPREFLFQEGGSDKFWNIDLQGKQFTVQFGRTGTAGQTPASASVEAAAPVEASTPVASTEVVRRLHLSPSELAIATRQRLERPAPRPFDREACLERLSRVTKGDFLAGWNWAAAEIPESMTADEARFWLHATVKADYQATPRNVAKQMREQAAEPALTSQQIKSLVENAQVCLHPSTAAALAQLLQPEEICELVTHLWHLWQVSRPGHSRNPTDLLEGIARHVVPYLSESQLKPLRERVLRTLDFNAPWLSVYHPLPTEYYLAAALGMTDEVKRIVARMTDTMYATLLSWTNSYTQHPQFLILRLGDPATVEAEMRRTKLLLGSTDQIRTWLALTQWRALDVIRDSILSITKREDAETALEAFASAIEAPEAAPVMLELKLQSKAPSVARQWLDKNLGCAIAGLIPVAAGKGKLAAAALDFLREKKRQGHGALIAQLAGAGPPEIAARIRQEVIDREEKTYEPLDDKTTPAWLKQDAADLKATKVPDWLPVAALPPIVVGKQRLNDGQVAQVIAALQKSNFDKEHPLLASLRRHADADALDAFAWAVGDAWLGTGAPSREKWGLMAVGFLGADRSVLKLTPLVRAWPGESQHQRAVLGLQCLRKVGSDTALMQLNGIAQKLKFKGLKEAAGRFMEEIAKDKGLTKAQLEDRIVPDCDLDERGSRPFDFGPRKFRFVLGPQLKPMIKDEAGAVKTDLPKPNAKDDAELAAIAVEDWKLLKKQIGEVAKIQAPRLEQAMVTGRRWPSADFMTLLVRHPLLINLVRLLLWGVFDDSGKLKNTFRVTDDQTLADRSDKELKLGAAERVGIVHPLQLKEEDMAAWGEIFSDYEILPPFPQLGRPTYALEKSEEKQNEITRFANLKIPGQTLVFGLEKLGWARGPALDNGCFDESIKYFPGADVTALVKYEGLTIGWMEGWTDQTIEHCFFVRGQEEATAFRYFANVPNVAPLKEVDKVVLSEVLNDLASIAAKGK